MTIMIDTETGAIAGRFARFSEARRAAMAENTYAGYARFRVEMQR